MTRLPSCVAILIAVLLTPDLGSAQGRGGGSRAAGAARATAGARPAPAAVSRPGGSGPVSRPSTPSLGTSRPTASRPNINQPAARPPATRPSGGVSGGLVPGTRPASPPSVGTRPNLPSSLPSRPGGGQAVEASRPGSRPTTSLPNLGDRPLPGNLPGLATRPGGGERPGLPTRPGSGDRPSLPNRPDVGDRPSLPNRPGTADIRPLPGDRPNLGSRPGSGTQPGVATRPSPSDLSDFLGMDRPLRPDGGTAVTLPARPDAGDRPALGNRPGGGGAVTLPARPEVGDRPALGNRPGGVERPNLGDRSRWSNNTVISQRPAWVNIDRSVSVTIQNRWNTAFVNPAQRGWWTPPPARIGFWSGWAGGVRRHWIPAHRRNIWFTSVWWSRHPFPVGGWHFHFWRHSFPARHWWTAPAWGRVTTWFTWTAPSVVWAQPVFYDYGSGGNVIFQDDVVYIGGQRVATAEEFAMSAMDLATVPPPQSDEQAAVAEWLPLGTFAVSSHEKDVEPSHVIQLAVSQEGIVSGTLYNIDTEQSQAVQGQVDKDTQRVALRIGESDNVVAETGLYNLTQEEAPVLIHFGKERTENYLLVRLEYAGDEE